MRLAGTCSRYSASAMPQLTSAAMYHGAVARFFRWPYQAMVMNTLEATSSRMVCNENGMEDSRFMAQIIGCRGRMATDPLVVHADAHLIVVVKPAGLLSVPGRGEDKQDCASARVQRLYPDALVVHRLDMATSGLLLMARGVEMQRRLSRAFANREVGKRYVAVVAGQPDPPADAQDGWGLTASITGISKVWSRWSTTGTVAPSASRAAQEGVAERRRGDAVALHLALRDLHDRGRARALGGAQDRPDHRRVARRERAERVALPLGDRERGFQRDEVLRGGRTGHG